MSTYAQKSSAVRAARKQGLTDDTMVLNQNADGSWSFSSKAELDAALVRVSAKRGAKATLSSPIAEQIAAASEVDDQEDDVRPRFLRDSGTSTPDKPARTADEAFQADVAKRKAKGSKKSVDDLADRIDREIAQEPAVEVTASRRKRSAALEVAIASAPEKPAKASTRKTEERPDGLRAGSKAAILVDLVTRPEGATYQELLDATGWGECRPRLKEACGKAGLTLRLEKAETKGEPSRYFATR